MANAWSFAILVVVVSHFVLGRAQENKTLNVQTHQEIELNQNPCCVRALKDWSSSNKLIIGGEQFERDVRCCIQSEPDWPEGHIILAKTLAYHTPRTGVKSDQTLHENAWRELAQAERLLNGNATSDVYFHKANIASKLGLQEASQHAYEECLRVDPSHMVCGNNLAWVYYFGKDKEKGLQLMKRITEVYSLCAACFFNYGSMLHSDGDHLKAEAQWLHAVHIEQNLYKAWAAMGNINADRSHTHIARDQWTKAIQFAREANDEAFAVAVEIRAATVCPRTLDSFTAAADARDRFEANLDTLLEKYADGLTNPIDPGEANTDVGYYFVYLGFPNTEVRKKHMKLLRQVSPRLSDSNGVVSSFPRQSVCRMKDDGKCACGSRLQWLPSQQHEGEKPMRVGFLTEFWHEHSVSKLIRNIVLGLAEIGSRENIQVALFVLGTKKAHLDSISKSLLENDSVEVIYIDLEGFDAIQQVEHARTQVRAAQLDVLVFPELGMASNTLYIAHSRMAPTQIAFWGHPISAGLGDTIDLFVNSELYERGWHPARHGSKYEEAVWFMKGLTTWFDEPPVLPDISPSAIASAREHLLGSTSKSEHIYLCPQTAYKFHPLMDRALLSILEKDKQGVLVLINSKHPEWILQIRDRLALQRPDLVSRVRIVSQRHRDEFIAMLGAADVLLDTFPFGGGVSHFESMSAHAPVIVLKHGVPWVPQFAHGIYEYMFRSLAPDVANELSAHLIATSDHDFALKATRLGSDLALNRRVRGYIRDAVTASHLFRKPSDTQACGAFINEWLQMLRCATAISKSSVSPA